MFNILLLIIYSYFSNKYQLIINNTILVTLLFVLQLELIADKKYKESDITTSKFYLTKFSRLNFLRRYMLSTYFTQLVIYVTYLIICMVIEMYLSHDIDKLLEYIFTLPLMIFISLAYCFIEKIMVCRRVKINGFLYSYVLLIVIILYFLIRGFVLY